MGSRVLGSWNIWNIKKLQYFTLLMIGVVSIFSLTTAAFAAHPLITDDTGTQGKGEFQLEVNGEYGNDEFAGVTAKSTQVGTTLSYGLTDPIDVVLTLPYRHISVDDAGTVTRESGISDISLECKWRFYEREDLSLAIKPGFGFPTGNEEKGLGSGKMAYSLFLIATKEIKPWVFHANLGYIRNDNKVDEQENLWHASFAATVDVIKDLKLVANIGIERNADKDSRIDPAFVVGGLIYSLSEDFDIDFGIKRGITKAETDYTVLAGMAWRF